jgi:VanZ family protein
VRVRLWLWVPPVTYMAVIFYLSSQQNPIPALTERVWDKGLHTIEYGGLGLLFCRALIGEGVGWVRAAVLAACLTTAYGSTDEWHQLFTPGRSSDVRDLIADAVGGVIGASAYVAVRRLTDGAA